MSQNIQAPAKEYQDNSIEQWGVVSLRAEGNDLPLFLVHTITGEALPWGRELARHIDENIPVYGLSAEPSAKLTVRTMQGMAARLIQAIRTIQPKGPYRIAGWSFGGMLAYEMAIQLIGNDDEVQFLGLLDTSNGVTGKGDAAKNILHDNEMLHGLILSKNPSAATLKELEAIDSNDLDALSQKCLELSLVPEGCHSPSAEELRLYFARTRMHMQARDEYEAQPMNIPVHLFVAQDGKPDEPSLGWNKVLPAKRLFLIPVPGSHVSMVQEPDVAALGAELSRCIREKNQETSPERASPDMILVPIIASSRAKGSIFCVPGAGGNATSFLDLADALGNDWRIYGLQPRGLDGVAVPHSTVPAAARTYLRYLKDVCPAGPVHLLGHSFGGWVVFEMALQLQASGRLPSSLTLIDSETPHSEHGYHRDYTRVDILMKLVEIWEMTAGCSLNINAEALEARTSEDQLLLLHEQAIRVGLVPRKTKPTVLTGIIRTLAAALRTHYHPAMAWATPMNFILLADPKLDSEAQERQFVETTADWRHWAPELEVWRGPGNHMTALQLPDVKVLANWVRTRLLASPQNH